MRAKILKQQFDEERALYHAKELDLVECEFCGPKDGESALKEATDITLSNCCFLLRYPLWHVNGFQMQNCIMEETSRAAIWYAEDATIKNSKLLGIKAVRECRRIAIEECEIVSMEFGWKSQGISLKNTKLDSEYAFLDSKDVQFHQVDLKGKYSMQYMKNVTIENSNLDTKDAFWHSENVTVKDSVVRGEYLGWYSDGLTFINCRIIGTQPLCYCKNLKLIHCTMEEADLAFEYSDVEADILGNIVSIKNPKLGTITADSIGEIIMKDAVMNCNGNVIIRSEK